MARRLYDYRHLGERRSGARPWILRGEVTGRGPDNEPLVVARKPVAWIDDAVLREAVKLVESQGAETWGPLDRQR